VEPVGLTSCSGRQLQGLPFLPQHRFVIDLVHIAWRKVHKGLMSAVMVIVVNIPSNLLAGRDLIGIIPHQIDLFLFQTPVKPFRDGIVRGTTDTRKREIRFEILKELIRYPRSIQRAPIHSKLGFLFSTPQKPLAPRPPLIAGLHMRGIDGRHYLKGDQQPGEPIDDSEQIPPGMPDAQLRPIAAPQKIPLSDLIARLLPGRLPPDIGLDLAPLL
jgi:hypothetical protein